MFQSDQIMIAMMYFQQRGVRHEYEPRSDRTARESAMVTLFEAGYTDRNDIARAFGCTPRTLRRYQARIESGGLLSDLADVRHGMVFHELRGEIGRSYN